MTKPPMENVLCGCGGCNVCMMQLALSGRKPPDVPRVVPAVEKKPVKPEQKKLFE